MGPTKWSQEHRLIPVLIILGMKAVVMILLFHFSIVRIQVDLIVMLIIGPELFDRDYNVLIYVPTVNDPNVVYDGISEIEVLNHIADLA